MAYTISSDKGKEIAKNLGTGKTYTASDGSTWKKESDGSVTVTEKNGAVHNNAYTSSSNKPLGADDKSWGTVNSSFEASKDVNKADKKSQNALSSLESLVNKEDIISDSVMNALNAQFVVPSAVTEADKYLAEQLGKIQSGKTSYSDQVRDMIDKIMNREKFSYDVDTDPLFQQALASAMNSGKQAMQDTIGQASALTGGYGSTYATTAGNQAYNAFIEDAYDNLPQYYQMDMEAYQMEGEEMYRQYSMLSTEDDKEYNRNVTAFDATSQYRNQIYNEAYTQYRDGINDAFAMANLQLNEHGQRVSDATNYYNATSDYSDKLYQREYNSWLDSINNAWKTIELGNSDYWNQTNFDEGVRQFDANYAQNEDHFTRNQEFQANESQKQRDWQTSEAEKDRAFTASENAKSRAASRSSSGGGGTYKLSTTEINGLTDAYNNGGVDGAMAYLNGIGKTPTDENSLSVVENLLVQADSTAAKKLEANTPKSGTISEFRSKEGDNFTVKVGGKTYGVENHGKVTDSTTLKSLNKLNTSNGSTFLYNGDAYVKSGDGYYLIGAKMFGGKDYEALKKALQK